MALLILILPIRLKLVSSTKLVLTSYFPALLATLFPHHILCHDPPEGREARLRQPGDRGGLHLLPQREVDP